MTDALNQLKDARESERYWQMQYESQVRRDVK